MLLEALEYCASAKTKEFGCSFCPLHNTPKCESVLAHGSLGLITLLKTKNESLVSENRQLSEENARIISVAQERENELLLNAMAGDISTYNAISLFIEKEKRK